ncbi:MAG: hypothetical protein ACRD5E_14905, partial [Nitrososphaeraceae archaeon]
GPKKSVNLCASLSEMDWLPTILLLSGKINIRFKRAFEFAYVDKPNSHTVKVSEMNSYSWHIY